MKAVVFVLATIFAAGLADLDPAICTSAGRICVSCSELAVCVLAGEDYNIIHLEYCNAGEACTPEEGCITDPVDGCYEPLDFVCTGKGMFPEPFDCRKYHFCVPDNGHISKYSVTCGAGFGYDPITFSCSTRLDSNDCPKEGVVPVCHTSGQTGPLSNPSLYYICVEYSATDKTLYPFLFACPHGGHYHDYSCQAARQYTIDSKLSGTTILQ